MTKIEGTPWTMAKDHLAREFKGEAISIFELFRDTLKSGSTVIEGRAFVDCRLEGPAIMAVLDGVKFDHTDFGYTAGDVGKIVWRTESKTGVVGAVPFRKCTFLRCSFFATGFTGPEPFLQQILALKIAT